MSGWQPILDFIEIDQILPADHGRSGKVFQRNNTIFLTFSLVSIKRIAVVFGQASIGMVRILGLKLEIFCLVFGFDLGKYISLRDET